jgi:hypothetical protein
MPLFLLFTVTLPKVRAGKCAQCIGVAWSVIQSRENEQYFAKVCDMYGKNLNDSLQRPVHSLQVPRPVFHSNFGGSCAHDPSAISKGVAMTVR